MKLIAYFLPLLLASSAYSAAVGYNRSVQRDFWNTIAQDVRFGDYCGLLGFAYQEFNEIYNAAALASDLCTTYEIDFGSLVDIIVQINNLDLTGDVVKAVEEIALGHQCTYDVITGIASDCLKHISIDVDIYWKFSGACGKKGVHSTTTTTSIPSQDTTTTSNGVPSIQTSTQTTSASTTVAATASNSDNQFATSTSQTTIMSSAANSANPSQNSDSIAPTTTSASLSSLPPNGTTGTSSSTSTVSSVAAPSATTTIVSRNITAITTTSSSFTLPTVSTTSTTVNLSSSTPASTDPQPTTTTTSTFSSAAIVIPSATTTTVPVPVTSASAPAVVTTTTVPNVVSSALQPPPSSIGIPVYTTAPLPKSFGYDQQIPSAAAPPAGQFGYSQAPPAPKATFGYNGGAPPAGTNPIKSAYAAVSPAGNTPMKLFAGSATRGTFGVFVLVVFVPLFL